MTHDPRTILVLGGARSGKSRHAQRLAEAWPGECLYFATAQAFDAEMEQRIARHQADRDARWQTVEAPIALCEAMRAHDRADRVFLIDCLTLWVSNLLLAEADIPAAGDGLCDTLSSVQARVILVSNEVGFGIVPDNALARAFRDAAGTLNQRVAAVCDATDLVVAGIPMRIAPRG